MKSSAYTGAGCLKRKKNSRRNCVRKTKRAKTKRERDDEMQGKFVQFTNRLSHCVLGARGVTRRKFHATTFFFGLKSKKNIMEEYNSHVRAIHSN